MVPNPGRRGGRRRWAGRWVGGEGRGGGGRAQFRFRFRVAELSFFVPGRGRGNWRSSGVSSGVSAGVGFHNWSWNWSWNWSGSGVSSCSGSSVGFVMIHSVIRILPRRSLQTKHVGVEKTSKLLPRLASRGQQTERKSPTRTRSDVTSRATCE